MNFSSQFDEIEQQLAETKGRLAELRALCATLVPQPPPIVRRFRPGHYWYVQSGLPFAGPEQIAEFCAGNPL